MERIIDILIDNFDWAFILSINVLTYIIIKIIDFVNKEKDVSVLVKKIVLIVTTLILAVVYKFATDIDNRTLINSAILAPVAWDYVLRPIIKKINLGYKEPLEK